MQRTPILHTARSRALYPLALIACGFGFLLLGACSSEPACGSACGEPAPGTGEPALGGGALAPMNVNDGNNVSATNMTPSGESPLSNLPIDMPGSEQTPPSTDTPPAISSELLDAAVKFYGAQRSGDGANWLLGGATCHVSDGSPIDADLSGGWYDAGDHLKVTSSMAYASYVMLTAFEAYPEAFVDRDDERYSGAPNGVPDVLDEVRYATDYFVKAHITETEIVAMIGTTQPDHSRWVTCMQQETLLPENGGPPRNVNRTGAADVAGIASAALAAMSRLYRPYDATLAESYQTHAVQIYDIGRANQRGTTGVLYAQNGQNWVDEMFAGATQLYRLTNEAAYLTEALEYNTRIENHGWSPHYGQSADFTRYGLHLAGQADAVAEFWRLDVESYAARVSSNEFTAGMAYFDDWGALRYSAASAFSAALYSKLTGDTAAREYATSQLAYVSGTNSYGRSFVVGVGTNAPEHPHHRNADQLGVLLKGALVAGPTQRNYVQGMGANAIEITTPGYDDDVEDYVGNEVALDYNAGLVGLAAFGLIEQRVAASAE